MIPERVLAPFSEASFRSGLVIGLFVLGVGVLAALAWRVRRRQPLPVAGLLIAAAGVLVLQRRGVAAPGLASGVVVLGLAGLVADLAPRTRPLLPILAVPGAWVLATEVVVDQAWAPLAIGVTVALGGALVADFDHRSGARSLGPASMVVALMGVFVTVPETKEALPVLGAVLPLALLGWPTGLATLGAGGALSATGLLAWTVAQGGTFRDSAIVGGLACLGLLVVEPVGRRLAASTRALRAPRAWVVIATLAGHVVVVAVAARVAGLADDLSAAVVVAGVALLVGVGVSAALASAPREALPD